jgi:hypothetical protein
MSNGFKLRSPLECDEWKRLWGYGAMGRGTAEFSVVLGGNEDVEGGITLNAEA